MTDKLQRLRDARDGIDPGWDASQQERVLQRVHGRLRAHRSRRRALTALALVAGVCAAAFGGVRYGRRTASVPVVSSAPAIAAVPTEEDVLRYPDGSAAFSTSPGTRLQLEVATADRVVTTLERGAARFEVVPDHEREFRVRIESVTVTVLGTIFAVTRRDHDVHVAVQRGKVRIESPGATAVLEAGSEGDYALEARLEPATSASAALPPRARRRLRPSPGGRSRAGAVTAMRTRSCKGSGRSR